MRIIHRLRALVRNIVRRSDVDRDLTDELTSYVELSADERRAAGESTDIAARHARLQLGGAAAVTESVRANRAGASIERFWQDVRYAVRGLRRTPSYSVSVVVTLALSLGLATAVFSLVYGMLWRPFPVARPDEVVALFLTRPAAQSFRGEVAGARFDEWRKRNEIFAGMAAATTHRVDLLHQGAGARVESELISADFFQVLGVAPLFGRVLTPQDIDAGQGAVPCVIAEGLWRRMFGADPQALGQSFQASGITFTVVGVVADAFARWRQPAEIWAPYALTPTLVEPRVLASDGYLIFDVFGRLRQGITQTAAQDAMTALDPRVHELLHGYVEPREGVAVVALRDATNDTSVKRSLTFLWVSALLVVGLATANVAGLTLTKSLARAREIATRLALGGARTRVTGQLAAEPLVLMGAGIAAALVVQHWVRPILVALAPPEAAKSTVIAMDWRALAFVVGIAGAMLAVMAMAAAVHVRRAGLDVAVRTPGGSTPRPLAARAQAGLVFAQATISVPIVVAAVLLMATVARLNAIDLGFQPRGLEVMQVYLPVSAYNTSSSVSRLADALRERTSGIQPIAQLAVSTNRAAQFFQRLGAATTWCVDHDRGWQTDFERRTQRRIVRARLAHGHPGIFPNAWYSTAGGTRLQRNGPCRRGTGGDRE